MQISLYVIITCIIIYSLSLVAKSAPDILSAIWDALGTFMTIAKPVIIGFIIAYLLDGPVGIIERRLEHTRWFRRKKSCRGLAVALTCLLILGFFSLIISLLIYSVTKQIRLVSFEDISTLIQGFTESMTSFFYMIADKLNSWNIQSEQIKNMVSNVSTYFVDYGTDFVNGAVGSVSGVTSFFTTFFFSIIIAIYFLIDGKMICKYINKVSIALFSERFNRRVRGLVDDINTVFTGYMKGQLLDVVVMMVLTSVSLSIIGVKFSVVIGICAGIGNLIPYCGPFIAYGSSAIVCLINGEITKLIISLLVLVTIQAVDANIIGPKLLSQSIEVHPLLVIISLIFGSAIGGLFGMFLAVPVGALIKVLFNRFIDNRIKSKEEVAIKEEKQ